MWLFYERIYERDQAFQDSRHRDQSTAGAFADGGCDGYFISTLAEAAWRHWSDCFRIHIGRGVDA